MKYLAILILCFSVSGCNTIQVVATTAAGLYCGITTEDARSKIRDGQKIETDLCGFLEKESDK